jgi:hypothetical protein
MSLINSLKQMTAMTMNKAVQFSIRFTLGAAILCQFSGLQAQVARSGKEDTLKTRIVTVFDYKPTISDAKKQSVSPVFRDTTLQKPQPRYAFERYQYPTIYTPDTIQAAKMKGEPLDPLYRSFVKGGLGNGVNYLLDAYVNAVRSREGALGVELHGVGTQGVLSELPPAPYNYWNTNIHGKRFLKKHELTSTIGWSRERVQYYGYSYSDSLVSPTYLEYQGNEDVFRQVYTGFNADLGLKSFYTDSNKLNHKIDLHYDWFGDRNQANTEHNLLIKAEASKFFGSHRGSLGLFWDQNAATFVQPQFDSIANSEVYNNAIIGLNPKLTSQAEKWRLELGLKVQFNSTSGTTDLRLYPDVYAKYNLVKEVLIPYAGFTGGLQRNNLRGLVDVNPFIWPALTQLRNTDQQYHVFGGFRGTVTNRFTYNLYAGQYVERGAPLFVNYNASAFNAGESVFGQNYFLVAYDTVNTFEIGGELTYRLNEKIHVVGSGVFRSFTTRNEAFAWHRPNAELHVTGFYQLQHKIVLKGQLHVLGPQRAKAYKTYVLDDPEAVDTEFFDGLPVSVISQNIKPIIDASLGVEYRYTERLSAFMNLNNVLVQRYQRWNQFPVQRFNVMAGLTYLFWKE